MTDDIKETDQALIVAKTSGIMIFRSPLRLIIDPLLQQGVPCAKIYRKLRTEYPADAPALATIRGYRTNYYLPSRSVTADKIQLTAPKVLDTTTVDAVKDALISPVPKAAPAVDLMTPELADSIEGDIKDIYARIAKLKASCFVEKIVGSTPAIVEVTDTDVETTINNLYKTINSLREMRQKYRLDEVAEAAKVTGASIAAQVAIQVFIPAVEEAQRRPLLDQFKAKLNDAVEIWKKPPAPSAKPELPPNEPAVS